MNSGHWKRGSALTSGEEQEQTNAKMSRYVNSTKYMNKAGKRKSKFHKTLHNGSY